MVDIGKTKLRQRPEQVPDGLCINSDQFQGSVLVQWLCRQLVCLGDSWTYNLIDTVGHICYSLMTLGVIQLVPRATVGESHHFAGNGRHRSYSQGQTPEDTVVCGPHDTEMTSSLDNNGTTIERFELDRFYRWTGGTITRTHFDDGNGNRIPSGQQSEQSVGLSAYHGELTALQREFDYELAKLVRSHEVQLFRVKNQGVMKACQLTDRIEALEKEVEKYRILAGIEHLTKQTENSRQISASLANEQDSQISPAQSPEDRARVTKRYQSPDIRFCHLGMTRVGFSLSGERLDRSVPPKPPPRARVASDTNDLRSTLLKLANGNAKLTNQDRNSKYKTVQVNEMQARVPDMTSSAAVPYGHEGCSDSTSNSTDKSELDFSQVMDCKDVGKSSSTVKRSRSHVKDHSNGISHASPFLHTSLSGKNLSRELSQTLLEQTRSLDIFQVEKEH